MAINYKLTLPEGDLVNTTVIRDADEAAHFISNFMDSISTGSKSYGTPGFVGLEVNKAYIEENLVVTEMVALLTLVHFDTCLIFQLHRFDRVPRSLAALLQLPEVVFCSVGMKCCLESLRRDYGLVIRNAVDLKLYKGNGKLPFRKVRSGSSVLLGDWDPETLSTKQVLHVTTNAFSYWRAASGEHD